MITTQESNTKIRPLIGPFDFFDGSDGADDTLNIRCLSTDRWILALYYWGLEELPSKVPIARAITTALNLQAEQFQPQGLTSMEWSLFFTEYSAPFSVRKLMCEHEGPMFQITDSEGEAVAYRKVWDSVEQAEKDALRRTW